MWWRYYVSGSLSILLYGLFFLVGGLFLVVLKEGISVYFSWEICFLGGASVAVDFIFDWVSLSFGGVVLLISASVMVFTCEYMKEDIFLPRFSWLVFLFVLSMSFVIFIPNLVAILLGWDGLGLVSFLLVIYYQNYKSLAGGMLTVLMNRVGDVMILLSIGFLCKEGAWHIFYLYGDSEVWLVCLFILVAGMTKSAQIPFSSWLPAAMAAPTPVSALVHSSTLVTAGVFLLIRFFNCLQVVWWFQPLLLLVATMTMLMAGIAANLENDLKKVIALSTLSQLGVMMAALGIGAWKLSLFHLYTHAMFKALLFLCAGAFIQRSQHNQDLRLFGMVWGRAPVIVSCLHVSNLALCGAPFLAGFYSKDMILESGLFLEANWGVLFMVFLATGMTVSYSVRLSYLSLWGTFGFFSSHNWEGESAKELVPVMVLMGGAVIGGSFFMWVFFYGEGNFLLSGSAKLVTLVVVLVGGIIGWVMNDLSSVSEIEFSVVRNKSYFGLVYMWFLVYVSTQGVVQNSLWVGKSFLYQGDRGWLEVLGGLGSYSLIKKIVLGSQEYGFGGVLVYLSSILFLVGGIFVFLIF
uniref:NADH-ubiquinone oxidoreductase chain 5 n=1 Tax=Yininemertes pratensis TaxID=2057967 RepID=A0A7U3W2U2_9BILA|nr:NADH dehydrogenase subunit 5 [Yininemertes pratensis]QQP01065.1 NADH dehydrogenase subunit 5 [Yininemertes pratensis]